MKPKNALGKCVAADEHCILQSVAIVYQAVPMNGKKSQPIMVGHGAPS
jgi:hypothetical protein